MRETDQTGPPPAPAQQDPPTGEARGRAAHEAPTRTGSSDERAASGGQPAAGSTPEPTVGRTALSQEQLRRALAPFGLRPRAAEQLDKGTVNSNHRVRTDGGLVFLRINEGKREADVRYEGELLWHLGARRFPTPQPLRTTSGVPYATVETDAGPRFVTVFPWREGGEIDLSRLSSRQAAHMGEVLARLHLAARDFPHRREGIYTLERIAARVEGFRAAAAADPVLRDVLPTLDEEIAWLRRSRRPQLPRGTIHGDLFPDNVLWRGDEVVAVLDFEQASHGPWIYDLAVMLLAWCVRDDERPGSEPGAVQEPLGWSMLSGYRRVRELSDEETEALWAEARWAALRFTVTRVTDVYLPSLPPRCLPVRPGKEFGAYLARLLRLRARGPLSMEVLLEPRPPLRSV